MNTLIIHPGEDYSTAFLKQIYKDIPCCLITKNLPKDELIDAIIKAQNILFLGHGDKNGLFNPCEDSKYIIDSEFGKLIESKNCLLIWCNADEFVSKNNLNFNGIYTGMFISEISELIFLDENFEFEEEIEAYKPMIFESNEGFAKILGRLIIENSLDNLPLIYERLKLEYKAIAKQNEVAAYNYERLFLSSDK